MTRASAFTPTTSYPEIVGHILAEVRREAGLSQRDLSDMIGVTQSCLSKLERGVSPLSVGLLATLAAALDTTPGALTSTADRVSDYAGRRGVHVETVNSMGERLSDGLVVVGRAALFGIVSAALAE